ncbi:MAG: phosphosulfolactate synthase, partial [Deltaproteobacteria bacterium]|nr:phosphosulfolactate synthase [Deltaproteobacteria bacterium]
MNKPTEFAFCNISVQDRQRKPRTCGLTMMIDWGLPHSLQIDCLESQGIYVDEAKIAASISKTLPLNYLKKKIDAYKKDEIFTFPGGLLTEVAIAKGRFE